MTLLENVRKTFACERFLYFVFVCLQYDTGGADGEKGTVFNDAPLSRWDFHIIDKGASIAVVVTKGIAQTAFLVTADVEGAVVQVHAGVNSLEGRVDGVAFLVAANDIITHPQRDDLLVVKHVLDDGDETVMCLLVR